MYKRHASETCDSISLLVENAVDKISDMLETIAQAARTQ